MSIFGVVENWISEAEHAASDALDDVAGAFDDAAHEFVVVFDGFGDWVVESEEDVEKRVEQVAKELEHAVDDAVDAVEDAVQEVGKSLDALVDAVESAVDDLAGAVVKIADEIAATVKDVVDFVVDDVLPIVYGVLKLLLLVPILLVVLPALVAAMLVCSVVQEEWGHEGGTVFAAIVARRNRYANQYRIGRLDAAQRYVIFSDLHRYAPGDLDIPLQQGDKDLYAAVLSYYGRDHWHLVENGDVEDYWLRGGSNWGNAYDVASGFIGVGQDLALEAGIMAIAKAHLTKIITNNAKIYAVIKGLFIEPGRYHRTMGNHDDVYRNEELVEVLRRLLATSPEARRAFDVHDYLVVEGPNGANGLIGHGHQSDSWNSPACSFLGRTTTSIVSAINEVVPDAYEMGVPSWKDSHKLWVEGANNNLTGIGPFGADLDTNSLDEQHLHDTYREQWHGVEGPHLILGHTHAVRQDPFDPDRRDYWPEYLNDGCGISSHTVTAVEWDGSQSGSGSNPSLTLVAWRASAADEIERGVVRTTTVPDRTQNQLIVVPSDTVNVHDLGFDGADLRPVQW